MKIYYTLILITFIFGCKKKSELLTNENVKNLTKTRDIASLTPNKRLFKIEWEDNFSNLNEQQQADPCYNFNIHKPQCTYQNSVGDCNGNLDHLKGLNTCIWRIMSFYSYYNKNFEQAGFSPYEDDGQVFSHKNIEIKDGKLIFYASVNPDFMSATRKCGPDLPNDFSNVGENCPYTSGGITSEPALSKGVKGFHKLGGRFEARIRFSIYNGPNAKSLYCSPQISTWPTFWFIPVWGTGFGLYKNKGWPLNGEIDVVDYLYSPDWKNNKTPIEHELPLGLISGDANGEEKQVNKLIGIGVSDIFKPNSKINCENKPPVGPWHDYAVEWKPNEFIRLYKDEVLLLSVDQGEMVKAIDGKMRPIQIPVGSLFSILELTLPHWANADNVTGKKNRMEVDYIKYSRFCTSEDVDCYTPTQDLLIKRCPNKGYPSGNQNCQVYPFKSPILQLDVDYWIDAKKTGVYYDQYEGKCPFGGKLFGSNCKIAMLPQLDLKIQHYLKKTYPSPGVYYKAIQKKCPYSSKDIYIVNDDACLVKEISQGKEPVLFNGIEYSVKNETKPPLGISSKLPWGVYYNDKSSKCLFGGTLVTTGLCKVVELNSESMDEHMQYWVDTNPLWPGIYYLPNF